MILHIPHSSPLIPDDIRRQFILSDKELEKELLLMTDLYTDDLFSPLDEFDTAIIYPVSRLVVDPERFIVDDQESMSKKGMGVIYTKTAHGQDLRDSITGQERKMLINMFYHWHHNLLTSAVEAELKIHGSALIVDCHSFPSAPLPYEYNQSPDRPDICIGTDSFHTPDVLDKKCIQVFQEKGYSVKLNEPFSGTMISRTHKQKNKDVHSIMIEVNRSLYMDENTGEKKSKYEKIKSDLEIVMGRISELLSTSNSA